MLFSEIRLSASLFAAGLKLGELGVSTVLGEGLLLTENGAVEMCLQVAQGLGTLFLIF